MATFSTSNDATPSRYTQSRQSFEKSWSCRCILMSRIRSAGNLSITQRPSSAFPRSGLRITPAPDFSIVSTPTRSEEHTSELQSLMRISYAVFCLKHKNTKQNTKTHDTLHD